MDYSFGPLPQYSVLTTQLFIENVAYLRLSPLRVLQNDRFWDFILAFFIIIVIISGEAIEPPDADAWLFSTWLLHIEVGVGGARVSLIFLL